MNKAWAIPAGLSVLAWIFLFAATAVLHGSAKSGDKITENGKEATLTKDLPCPLYTDDQLKSYESQFPDLKNICSPMSGAMHGKGTSSDGKSYDEKMKFGASEYAGLGYSSATFSLIGTIVTAGLAMEKVPAVGAMAAVGIFGFTWILATAFAALCSENQSGWAAMNGADTNCSDSTWCQAATSATVLAWFAWFFLIGAAGTAFMAQKKTAAPTPAVAAAEP